MANDPRSNTQLVMPCPPAYLPKSQAGTATRTQGARAFYDAVNKAGDLQVLKQTNFQSNTLVPTTGPHSLLSVNNSRFAGNAGNSIGQGLSMLAGISNTVRTGCGSVPTVLGSAIGTSLDAGADWVLQNVGMSKAVVDQAQYFNPAIANQAYGQAKAIFTQVQSGQFSLKSLVSGGNLTNALQDLQNLERLARNIYTPPESISASQFSQFCESSPYAVDFVFRMTKYKFLYLVQFIFNPGYENLGNLDFVFMVKKSTRPSMQIEMEDVNYYNFRSKVITKTRFEDMTMSFHDDGLNYGTLFWTAYQRATAPIANFSESSNFALAEQNGMDFDNTLVTSGQQFLGSPENFYSATRGPLANDNKNIIREIRVFHLYNAARQMNVFKYFNPRITQLQMDDLDMAAGNDVSEFSMVFNYDSVYVDVGVDISDMKYGVTQQQRGAVYQIQDRTAGNPGRPNNAGFQPGAPPANTLGACNPANPQNTSIPPTAIPAAASPPPSFQG